MCCSTTVKGWRWKPHGLVTVIQGVQDLGTCSACVQQWLRPLQLACGFWAGGRHKARSLKSRGHTCFHSSVETWPSLFTSVQGFCWVVKDHMTWRFLALRGRQNACWPVFAFPGHPVLIINYLSWASDTGHLQLLVGSWKPLWWGCPSPLPFPSLELLTQLTTS